MQEKTLLINEAIVWNNHSPDWVKSLWWLFSNFEVYSAIHGSRVACLLFSGKLALKEACCNGLLWKSQWQFFWVSQVLFVECNSNAFEKYIKNEMRKFILQFFQLWKIAMLFPKFKLPGVSLKSFSMRASKSRKHQWEVLDCPLKRLHNQVQWRSIVLEDQTHGLRATLSCRTSSQIVSCHAYCPISGIDRALCKYYNCSASD